jgi:Na+/proline symporter
MWDGKIMKRHIVPSLIIGLLAGLYIYVTSLIKVDNYQQLLIIRAVLAIFVLGPIYFIILYYFGKKYDNKDKKL